ncbi:MAG: ABC transporter ATP-binding protein [Candidatus Hodarchaeales archaeon]
MSLAVEGLTSGYGKTVIIQDVSIYVDPAEVVTLIGPNGSGKSTLLKTIFGFLKAFSGKVTFEGRDITDLQPNAILQTGMGYVPQLNNVFPTLSVVENLEMGAFTREDAWEEDLEMLFGLFPILRKRQKTKARNLSGGEKQMLALSRALLTKPSLMLLDEPTAALAPNLVDEILEKLVDLSEQFKTSLLIVEQNARKSLAVSNRGYVLVMGKKAHEGPSSELLDYEEIARLYLGK